MQESQQVNVSSRDSDRLRHPNSQLLDEPWSTWKFPQSGAEETHLFAFKLQNLQESRHLEAQYEAAEQEAAEAQVEALTAQKAARQARLLGDQHVCSTCGSIASTGSCCQPVRPKTKGPRR